MNFIENFYNALDEAVVESTNSAVSSMTLDLIRVGSDPLVVADAMITKALAIASELRGEDLEARKMLVQWHRMTEGIA